MGPLQLMAAGGVVLTVGLILVGKFVNTEGESLRDTAQEARHARRETFNMAIQQGQAAQQRAHELVRMQMQAQMAEYEDYENFQDFEEFAELQYQRAEQYLEDR